MNDLISRQAAIMDAESWVAADEYEKHLQKNVVEWLKEFPPAELGTDTISRQAAIDALDCINGVEEVLRSLPSAQPERKTGRWIERNPQNSPDCRLIECSECGNAYIVGYNIDYDDWIDGRDFCMRCGADLRGGSNGKST